MGTGTNLFQNGQEGYIGFKYTTDSNTGPYYAWMRVTLTDSSSAGEIIDWAYDDTGAPITISGVPEPSRSILILVGSLSLMMRRRRTLHH